MELNEGERLDFLFFDEQLKIIQSEHLFSFSLDSLLLAAFVHVPVQKGKLIDLCSGNGAIPLMLSRRSKGQIFGVELQSRLHEMAGRSIAMNGLENRIHLICDDLANAPSRLGSECFDTVTCNPPYFSLSQEIQITDNPQVADARHQLTTSLEKVVAVSAKLLKQGGKAAFVYPADKFITLSSLMRANNLEPKRILWIHPKEGKEANRVLVEGKKLAKPGVRVFPPIVVYNENNEYTKGLRLFCDITSIL